MNKPRCIALDCQLDQSDGNALGLCFQHYLVLKQDHGEIMTKPMPCDAFSESNPEAQPSVNDIWVRTESAIDQLLIQMSGDARS